MPTDIDKLPQITIDTFREIQLAILDNLSTDASNVNDPKVSAKQQRVVVDALLQQLQSAIDKENSGKVQEVHEMKDMLATQEQHLAQMIKSNKPQSRQD